MRKAAQAFRTISEVAEILQTPAHVLRFWESKFTQVKPVKRAGGRRYYRPSDLELLAGIRKLLHDHGMTIRGVQKLLTEKGVRHVADYAPEAIAEVLEGTFDEEAEADAIAEPGDVVAPVAAEPIAQSHDASEAEPAPVVEAPEPGAPNSPDTVPDPVAGANAEDVDTPSPSDEATTDAAQEAAFADAGQQSDEPAAKEAVAEAAEKEAPPQESADPASDTDLPAPVTPESETHEAELTETEAAETDSAVVGSDDPGVAEDEPVAINGEQKGAEPRTAPNDALQQSEAPVGTSAEESLAHEPDVEVAPAAPVSAVRMAVELRSLDRSTLKPTPELDSLLRRMDALLDRMSKAGGAARW